MRRFATVIGCACALSYALHAGAALAGSPKGQIYLAHVFTSFGTEFEDCFFFSKTGKLKIDNYGTILYRFDALNSQTNNWQALAGPKPPNGFGLAFHGHVSGPNGDTFDGDGVSSQGATFILQGVMDPTCRSSARTSTSRYQH